ncbi:MAG: hypothetical protein AAGI71_06665 [Bacteroidota bacterium]
MDRSSDLTPPLASQASSPAAPDVPVVPPDRSPVFTVIGVLLIALSVGLLLFGYPFAYNITALAWGSIIIALDRYLRHKEITRRLDLHQEALSLRHEKEQWDAKQALFEAVREQGLPVGIAEPALEAFMVSAAGDEATQQEEAPSPPALRPRSRA